MMMVMRRRRRRRRRRSRICPWSVSSDSYRQVQRQCDQREGRESW